MFVTVEVPGLKGSIGPCYSLKFAQEQIEECLKDHLECKQPRHGLPTRLLDLRDGCRLCESSTLPHNSRYVTLSHCWGGLNICRLKRDNFDAFIQEIPQSALCKTFLDAIVVTRALGFAYLWIDSLCIIQDDGNDWRRESALMSEVYGNSIFNIAATYGVNGTAGLFVERGAFRGTYHIFGTEDDMLYSRSDFYRRCIVNAENAPLTQRAWAFQERFLAQRTLHFTTEQVFYECRCKSVPEKFPESISHDALRDMRKITRTLPAWSLAVQYYSRLSLTYSRDKLVALSGIARWFQNVSGDEYVAGLWRHDLERQLCWIVVEHENTRRIKNQDIPYRAPSWSWASIDGAIGWPLPSIHDALDESQISTLVKVTDVFQDLASSNILGELNGAHLTVKCGPLIKMSLFTVTSPDVYEGIFDLVLRYPIVDGSYIPDTLETEADTRDDLYILPILKRKATFCGKSFDKWDPNDSRIRNIRREDWPPRQETLFEERKPPIYNLEIDIYGLVVAPIQDKNKIGRFERIGFFWINLQGYTFLQFMSLLQSIYPTALMDEPNYSEILATDKCGSMQYEITLI